MEKSVKQILKCPVAIEWPIPEHHLQVMKDEPGKYLESDHFDATHMPGVKYSIILYPNGNTEENLGKTLIYFYLEFIGKIKIEAKINIIVPTAYQSTAKKCVFVKSEGWGLCCCTTEELFDPEKKFIVDGKFVIKVQGTLMIEQDIPIKNEPFGDHRDALCVGLWKQDNKDFTIAAYGKEIQAHKSVLSARSPVFAKMFESGMKEAQESKVTIEDFPFDIVEMAVKFCYHHTLVTYTSLEDKIKLLQFFDKYDIQPLKDDLEKYLITVINELTVCNLVNGSLMSNAPKLEEKCTEFLQKCLHERKPINDIELLDNNFAMNLFKNAFFQVSK